MKKQKDTRGLASANKRTISRVTKIGGQAPHPKGRGFQLLSKKQRQIMAKAGGMANRKRLVKAGILKK